MATLVSKIEKKVITNLPGSLPSGGTIGKTPVWFVKGLSFLKGEKKSDVELETIEFTDVRCQDPLYPKPFVLKNILSKEECDTFIQVCEDLGFRPEAPGIRTPPGMR